MPLQQLVVSVRDRLVQSRFFTISLLFHVILVMAIGTKVIVDRAAEPPTMIASILKESPPAERSKTEEKKSSVSDSALMATTVGSSTFKVDESIIRGGGLPSDVSFTVPTGAVTQPSMGGDFREGPVGPPAGGPGALTAEQRKTIGVFTDWKNHKRDGGYEFTAFLGKYEGGNWNATVRVQNGQITAGSLPNLLYATSKWTKDKIKTNERSVKAISLSSDELFTERPPFVFLSGTRDFKLTDKEVENLRKYIFHGGAIWGDSSVPGRRSAFDVAFKREMRRVMPDVDQKFEPLAAGHEVFSKGYFQQVRSLPAGINNYNEPVEVMKWQGEIAIIHTINDYGDMWQIGLDKEGKIDLSRNEHGQFVAMNETLWRNRGIYIRNIEQPAVEQAYRFGINMVFHLVTRWENRLGSSTL